MGVQGLQSFLEQQCPEAIIAVDLEQEAKFAAYSGRSPVLVVDLNSLKRKLADSVCDLGATICGGQNEQLASAWTEFVNRLRTAQIDPVFVAECTLPKEKRDTWISRRDAVATEFITHVFDRLHRGEVPSGDDHFNNMALPAMTIAEFLKTQLGCEVIMANEEADEVVVRLAKDRHAFGILSQDSDFLIFESGGARYFSAQQLDLSSLKTKAFNRAALASRLRLNPVHLPVLAILKGCDTFKPADLNVFHKRLIQGVRDRTNYSHKVIVCAANLIASKQLPTDVDQLLAQFPSFLNEAFGRVAARRYIVDAFRTLRTYLLLPDLRLRSGASLPPDWRAVVQHFQASCCGLKTIVCHQEFDSSNILEDFRQHDIPMYANQMLPFRRRLYGVLLHELPAEQRVVREWCYAGPSSLSAEGVLQTAEALPDGLGHPGLLKLRDASDRSKEARSSRVRLFAFVVSPKLLDTSYVYVLRTLSTESKLAYLVCQLFYVQHELEGGPLLHAWEVRVFILAQLLLLSASHEIAKRRLREDELVPDARGVQLAAIFTRFPLVHFNIAIGEPFPVKDLLLDRVFDGKIFQHLYKSVKEKRATTFELMDMLDLSQVEMEKIFLAVTSFGTKVKRC